jgi:hypothetical protein
VWNNVPVLLKYCLHGCHAGIHGFGSNNWHIF